jgi:hypothetical protein
MGTESGGVEKEGRDVGSGLGRSDRGRSSGTAGTATAEGRDVDTDTDVDRAPSGENSSAREERPGKVGRGATGLEAPVDREDASVWSAARCAS